MPAEQAVRYVTEEVRVLGPQWRAGCYARRTSNDQG